MAAHEGEFADEPPQLADDFVTIVVVGADHGDAGRQTQAARGLSSQRRPRKTYER